MIYLLLKTVHVAAVVVWIGGLLLQAFILSATSRLPLPFQPDERSIVRAAVRWDGCVTTPAMALAWMCGISIAVQGRWFIMFWLGMKLLLVILLSALHGYQSGCLRRLSAGGQSLLPTIPYAVGGTLSCMLIIVALVIFKPVW